MTGDEGFGLVFSDAVTEIDHPADGSTSTRTIEADDGPREWGYMLKKTAM
jgi:hypothetical protein